MCTCEDYLAAAPPARRLRQRPLPRRPPLTYRIEKSDTHTPGGFTTAATVPAGAGGIVPFTAPLPPKRFYRIAFLLTCQRSRSPRMTSKAD
jgi:hypothetical protein